MKRIVNNRPIFFSALLLAFGMIVSVNYFVAPYLLYIALGLSFILILSAFFIKPLKPLKIEIMVICAFFLLGFLYTNCNLNLYNGDAVFDGKTCTLSGTVSEINEYHALSYVTITGVSVEGDKTYGDAVFYTENDGLKKGDKLSIYGKVTFNPFTVSNYANKRTLSVDAETILKSGSSFNPFYSVSERLKNNILTNVHGDEGAVMVALLLGDTSEIKTETLRNFRLSGISHIFAVSGLHIVFFSSLICRILSLLRIKGYKNTVITALFTLFYAGVCGFPVSAVRAVIMSVTLNFVKNAGRKYDLLNSLFLSFIVVLLLFPYSLFTYGFILSYTAVFGIALFTKGFESLFSFLPEFIRSPLSVSFSVTTLMTPILFRMWGYSSLIVVFLNVVLVPIVSILYTLIFTVSIVSLIPFMSFLWKLPYYVSYFINSVLVELNVSSFTIYATASTVFLIIYYLLVLVACDRTNFKRPTKICCGSLSILALILAIGGII